MAFYGLVTDVGEHLRKVVMHVIEVHANNYPILSNRLDAKAEDCIDQLTVKAEMYVRCLQSLSK